MEQGQRSYVVAIDYDEQFRTANRSEAKALYNLVDEHFVIEVDGLKKQLIEVEANGWDSKVLFEDVIHCPKGQNLSTEEESEEDTVDEPLRRSFHR
jgi:mRNA degradation ribonuclease J1/J2